MDIYSMVMGLFQGIEHKLITVHDKLATKYKINRKSPVSMGQALHSLRKNASLFQIEEFLDGYSKLNNVGMTNGELLKQLVDMRNASAHNIQLISMSSGQSMKGELNNMMQYAIWGIECVSSLYSFTNLDLDDFDGIDADSIDEEYAQSRGLIKHQCDDGHCI
jgi:hypothetical protein